MPPMIDTLLPCTMQGYSRNLRAPFAWNAGSNKPPSRRGLHVPFCQKPERATPIQGLKLLGHSESFVAVNLSSSSTGVTS